MKYKEYDKMRDYALKLKEMLRQKAFETKGKRKERAAEGIKYTTEILDIINDLYGGVFEDEN